MQKNLNDGVGEGLGTRVQRAYDLCLDLLTDSFSEVKRRLKSGRKELGVAAFYLVGRDLRCILRC